MGSMDGGGLPLGWTTGVDKTVKRYYIDWNTAVTGGMSERTYEHPIARLHGTYCDDMGPLINGTLDNGYGMKRVMIDPTDGHNELTHLDDKDDVDEFLLQMWRVNPDKVDHSRPLYEQIHDDTAVQRAKTERYKEKMSLDK